MNFWIGKHNFNFIIHLLDQLQLRFVTELNTHFVQKFWLVCLSNKLFSKQIKMNCTTMTKFLTVLLERSGTPEGLRGVSSVNEKKQNCEILQKNEILAGFRKTTLLRLAELSIRFCFEFFSSNNGKTFFSFKILQSGWNYLTTLFSRLQIFHFSCNFLNRLCGVKLLFPVLNLATRGERNLSKNAKRVLGEIANRFFTYLEVELSG